MTDDILRQAYLYIYSTDELSLGLERLESQIAEAIEDVGMITACQTTDRGWQMAIEYQGDAIGRFVLVEVLRCLHQQHCTALTTLDNGKHRRSLPDWIRHLGLRHL